MKSTEVKRTVLRILWHVVALVAFISVTILLRGTTIGVTAWLNPDEAELMAQARAAVNSPLPFSTWASGTTGPFWVEFLALLGWLGFPLTIAFAHLLSAVLVGVIAYFVFVLLRRNLGLWLGLTVTLAVWLPIALIWPVGGTGDFGALSTEYLPSALVLGAALIPIKQLEARPWLFAVSGLLCGLAVGAKYQVLPLAIGLLVAQLIVMRVSVRRFFILGLIFAGGAAVPFMLISLGVLVSPTTSWVLLQQNVAFLGSYSTGVGFIARGLNTVRLVFSQLPIMVSFLILVWLGFNSTGRVYIGRIIIAAAGLVAVLAGGMGFGHYLIVLLVAMALAMTLPVREGARLLPAWNWQSRSLAVITVVVVSLFTLGPAAEKTKLTTPGALAVSLSASSGERNDELADACPAGSTAIVWGWAPEYYVNYGWNSAIPYMNILGVTSSPANTEAGKEMVEEAVSESDCIIDAVGYPFFYFSPASSIDVVYPELSAELESDFHVVDDLIECEECTVYVRN